MKFAIVIPTIPRKDIGYKYMLEALPINLKLFKELGIVDIWLYMNPSDEAVFRPAFTQAGLELKIIPIVSHPNNTFTGYDFWVRNLVYDAQYCINELAKLSNAQYLVRIEDDTVIYKSAFECVTKNITYRTSVGTLGIWLNREHLNYFNEVVDNNYQSDQFKPFDWLGLAPEVELIKSRNYAHIGEISTGGMLRPYKKITDI